MAKRNQNQEAGNPPKKQKTVAEQYDDWEDEPFTQGLFDVANVVDAVAGSTSRCKLMSLNVQSLFVHSADIASDKVFAMMDFLAFTETMSWERFDATIELPGFVCIAESKRADAAVAGVAIYQRSTATDMAVPHSIRKTCASYDPELGRSDANGDICAAEISVANTRALLICIYLSPDTTTKEKKFFLARNLHRYCREPMPMIVTGNFNIDMMVEENLAFADFMRKYLALQLASDPTQPTNTHGSCVNLTFTRNVRHESKRYYSHSMCHRPMLTLFEC